MTPKAEALLAEVHGTQMALVVYPARIAAIEQEASAEAEAEVARLREALVFIGERLARRSANRHILAQHTADWSFCPINSCVVDRGLLAEADIALAPAATPAPPARPAGWSAQWLLPHRHPEGERLPVIELTKPAPGEPRCACGERKGAHGPAGVRHPFRLTCHPFQPEPAPDLSVGTMTDDEWQEFSDAITPEGGS